MTAPTRLALAALATCLVSTSPALGQTPAAPPLAETRVDLDGDGALDAVRIDQPAAVSVTLPGKSEPIFGTVWIRARAMTDRDSREVTLAAVEVPQVRFPTADPENEKGSRPCWRSRSPPGT